MKNIVFLINSIGSGGAEGALFNLIKGIPLSLLEQVNVHLVLLDDEPRHRDIPKALTVHQLDAKRSMFKSILQTRLLLKTIKPDIVVSFLVRANIVNSFLRMLSCYRASIICERMHLSSHLKLQYSSAKQYFATILPKLLYKYNDLILGVSSGVSENLIQKFAVPRNKCKTIYNPYDFKHLLALSQKDVDTEYTLTTNFIVNIGRLTKSKDHDTLIKGFAKSRTNKSLVIIGIGELEHSLKALCDSLDVADRVIFTGYLSNPYSLISKASFFISSSKNEGFPNALLESMVLNKPCVFSSCDSGPAEIMGKHYNFKAKAITECDFGVLIPENSVKDVAKAIAFFEDNANLKKYTERSAIRAQDFTLNKIAQDYWREISRLANLANKT